MTGDTRAAEWDRAYTRQGPPPWDIGRPQPTFVRLADAGEIASPVLDCGCGTGENALMLTARGFDVTGVDLAPTAIHRAREKAAQRDLAVEFQVGDALDLPDLGGRFATVIDSGVFHVFDDADRARYVRSLASVVKDAGVVHLLCFSEHTPGTDGPRRVTQAELRAAFGEGWDVERIEATEFEVAPGWWRDRPKAWLARIIRRIA
jgi:SAM-dependent methyltransferase